MTIENISMINLYKSIGPGSNLRPLDQQSNSLPIALQCQFILGFLLLLKLGHESNYGAFSLSFCSISLLWRYTIGIVDCWVHEPSLSVRCMSLRRHSIPKVMACGNSKVTIVIHSNAVRRNVSAVQVIFGEK